MDGLTAWMLCPTWTGWRHEHDEDGVCPPQEDSAGTFMTATGMAVPSPLGCESHGRETSRTSVFLSHCLHFCFLNLSILFRLISRLCPLVTRESRKSYSRNAVVEFIIVLRMADFYCLFWCNCQRLYPAWTTYSDQFCEYFRTQVFSQAHSRFEIVFDIGFLEVCVLETSVYF